MGPGGGPCGPGDSCGGRLGVLPRTGKMEVLRSEPLRGWVGWRARTARKRAQPLLPTFTREEAKTPRSRGAVQGRAWGWEAVPAPHSLASPTRRPGCSPVFASGGGQTRVRTVPCPPSKGCRAGGTERVSSGSLSATYEPESFRNESAANKYQVA